jgi:hypothetical protein
VTPNWWGINEQQRHGETKGKRFYSLLEKKPYLLLLVIATKKLG